MSRRMGSVDFSELQAFRDRLDESLGGAELQLFIESCAKELAARLLANVIERTPEGDYIGEEYTCNVLEGARPRHKGRKSAKVGGTLRRGWTAGRNQSAVAYADSLNVKCNGDTYSIEIINPVEYAPYVEFGHRVNGKDGSTGWAEGHFMLTISSQEVRNAAPKILENKLNKKLSEVFR